MFYVKKLFFEEEGQTLVEYGFLLLFISIAVILAVGALGESLKQFFDGFVNEIPD